MNDLITNHQDRMSDRNHTEIFALLPSIGLSPDFNIEQAQQNFTNYSKRNLI